MSGRIILVTGGNGGLGRAVARTFLDESPDNQVWLGVRANRDKADALAFLVTCLATVAMNAVAAVALGCAVYGAGWLRRRVGHPAPPAVEPA